MPHVPLPFCYLVSFMVNIALLSFMRICAYSFVIGLSVPYFVSFSFSALAAWSYAVFSAAFAILMGRSIVTVIGLSLSVFCGRFNIEEFAMFEKPRMLVDEYITKKLLGRGKFEDGSEHPDPVPMAPPLGYVEQPNLWEQMRAMIRSEQLRQLAEEAGAETFEEADDFDVPDDIIPVSKYDVPDDDLDGVVVSSTGVPSPEGEGKGQGGDKPAEVSPTPAKEVAEAVKAS